MAVTPRLLKSFTPEHHDSNAQRTFQNAERGMCVTQPRRLFLKSKFSEYVKGQKERFGLLYKDTVEL